MEFTDERLDIREGNELARYFAWLKHDIQTIRHSWETSGRDLHSIQIGSSLYTSTYGLLGFVTDLDQAITIYELSANDSNLRRQISIFETYSYSIRSKLMRLWTAYKVRLLDGLSQLPPQYIKRNVQQDLNFLYNIEFERIYNLIEADKFAEILELNTSNLYDRFTQENAIPSPIKVLNDGTMLWTVGQAERYKKNLEYTHTRKWKLLIPIDRREQIFTLETDDDDSLEPHERVYDFTNNAIEIFKDIRFCDFSSEEYSKIIIHISKKIAILPEVYSSYAHQLFKEGKYSEAFDAFKKVVEYCRPVIPKNFTGKIFDGNQDYYQYSLSFLSYLYYLKGDVGHALGCLEALQPHLTLDYLDNTDGIEILTQDPTSYKRWFEVNFIHDYENMSPADKEWISSPTLREIDLSCPQKIRLDSNYNRQSEFQVTMSVREEIKKERLLFASIVATLVTLDEHAINNDPKRRWEGLGRAEGGIIFKNAAVTFQSDGVRVKDTEIPLEEQNLIYPLLTARVINRVCDYYISTTTGTVEERLLKAACKCVDTRKHNLQSILMEIKNNKTGRYIDSWSGFFGTN